MRLKIQARNVEFSRTFEEWIERRLWFALAKFCGRIRRITAWLEETNGPRGSVDHRCRVDVLLVPSGKIEAEATDADAVLAVSHATNRIAQRVRDALERRRTRRVRNRTRMREPPAA